MTRTKRTISALAIAISAGWAMPAAAQDDAAVAQELAQMRAQMAAMASRIDTLQAQLDAARAEAQAATTAAGAATASAAAATEAAKAEPATKIAWKGAPEIEGKDGWSFKPRGRLQYDVGFVNAPDSTGRPDGFGNEARRARLGVEGTMPGGFGYKFEVDVADSVEVTDAILTYKDGPATISIGQHNNFQSLEELTSSRFTSMIERAAFTDAFGFERRVGASVQYAKGPVLAQAGLFSDNIDALSNKNGGADGRIVFMPKSGSTQLHLGGSIHYADLQDGSTVRYRQRPLVHFTSQRFIDTGTLGASSETGYGLEAAVISGPLHAAAEQYWQHLNRPGALSDPTFSGGYAEVGYFLTGGDTRGYKGGTFDRVKPKNPVNKGGLGAVQVNLRYDWLDLVDAGIVGGKQAGYQASLIWTPTDYTRFLLNYGRMEYDNAIYPAAGGDRSYGVDAFGVRAQIDF
ncbi:porin [Tsuneonella sp. YG55]|uniref:Porin n=1 Tax=Tsuneonella litorea TaxID=2976475 RepID=A0A9X2W3K2_9SPHN|nr:porin [Tsuneonella litorea]MCT2559949.1 porin [Tsuneonella litorea]